MAKKTERSIITDKLLTEKTKKPMEHWFRELDKKGAKDMKHAEIFDLVINMGGLVSLGHWNQNLLTTSYEWDRGLKERGQKENGFEVSVSKTIGVPVTILYSSFTDSKIRTKWLKEKITIRKSTLNKSARVTWNDGDTSLSIDFYPKDKTKSQIVVQHQKLPDSKAAERMKEFWKKKLEQLKKIHEA
ncbi:MAG: hypothetical protein K0S12_1243 [Bacteroidetes bacterium]|nr:hypothetical protein [Bacteroidota bacterium]